MMPPSSSTNDLTDELTDERPMTADGPLSDVVDMKPRQSLVEGLIRTARPKQWLKNVLVFAAPASAGVLFHVDSLRKSTLAFAVFTLASIGTYFINDASDHKADSQHPRKRFRPVAAGIVGVRMAWIVGVCALVASILLAASLNSLPLAGLISGYICLTVSYSLWLKHMAVIDLTCVAAGFVLRMIAGGIATDIVISNWFLTVASFSSLFVVAGKRYAELIEMGDEHSNSRAVLTQYTPSFLRVTCTMALAVAIASYCQWAFDRAGNSNQIWYQLSAVPWGMGLLRYALLLEQGHGGTPEDVLLSDRVLQILGFLWMCLFGLGVYVH